MREGHSLFEKVRTVDSSFLDARNGAMANANTPQTKNIAVAARRSRPLVSRSIAVARYWMCMKQPRQGAFAELES